MAARLNKRHQQFVRDKIQASQLVNLLTNHALGKQELTPTQVRAAEILLKKSVPDLSSVAMTGEDGGPIEHSLEVAFVNGTKG
jgi:hypothetical protein